MSLSERIHQLNSEIGASVERALAELRQEISQRLRASNEEIQRRLDEITPSLPPSYLSHDDFATHERALGTNARQSAHRDLRDALAGHRPRPLAGGDPRRAAARVGALRLARRPCCWCAAASCGVGGAKGSARPTAALRDARAQAEGGAWAAPGPVAGRRAPQRRRLRRAVQPRRRPAAARRRPRADRAARPRRRRPLRRPSRRPRARASRPSRSSPMPRRRRSRRSPSASAPPPPRWPSAGGVDGARGVAPPTAVGRGGSRRGSGRGAGGIFRTTREPEPAAWTAAPVQEEVDESRPEPPRRPRCRTICRRFHGKRPPSAGDRGQVIPSVTEAMPLPGFPLPAPTARPPRYRAAARADGGGVPRYPRSVEEPPAPARTPDLSPDATVLLQRSVLRVPAEPAAARSAPARVPVPEPSPRRAFATLPRALPRSRRRAASTARAGRSRPPACRSPDNQALHEEARRLARLLVSEIKLYNEEQVEEGAPQPRRLRAAEGGHRPLAPDVRRARRPADPPLDRLFLPGAGADPGRGGFQGTGDLMHPAAPAPEHSGAVAAASCGVP